MGRVVTRGLGRRGDSDDSDGAPQRRRPTASARRRRVPVIVDDHVPTIPADSAAVPEDTDEPEGFPGGPKDPTVLTEYADHVAANVWFGQERPDLKLSSHERKVHNLGRLVPTIEDMVAGTRLSPLIACSIDTDDRGLISSFVERWHWETSSFHLPVGDASITLDDVASLLHLPIVGEFHDFQPLRTDEAVLLLVELLMVSAEVAMAKTGQCGGPYIRLQWLRDVYQCRCQTQHWIVAARTYVLHLLGCTLFANKSVTHVHVVHLEVLRDLNLAGWYAWGAVGLIHMYDQLNDVNLSTSRQLAGYITLLQCWIYEHFSSVAECNANSNYDKVSPRACRWIAIKKTVKKLRWGPVVVRYRPERVMRQFGYVQCIPAHPVHSWVSYDDVDDTWTHYSDHLVAVGDLCVVPDPDADKPRHAVEVCHAITEALEQHLNAPDTSTHEEVIQKCLRIARGVTEDRNVYVRSRRRRRMDQQ
ncbi:protein MAIN-LIKE 1-like [Glycine soja]|uniref:protein MAIN-LIKE 1-like n=1 Tax=Glycine soja TaxID=3848 RepID=UPI00103FA871|nr:protein MAIN-LIKE 1-like [Glycine soja]